MEWIARQLCFAVFVLLAGWVLRLGGEQGDSLLLGMLCPTDDSPWQRCKQLAVPTLLYAAVELCCCGKHAAVLLPVRMLSLLYGSALYVGMFALVRLWKPGTGRRRALTETAVLLLSVSETTLLGYVLLRDGYCRGGAAVHWGMVGMCAALCFLFAAARRHRACSVR